MNKLSADSPEVLLYAAYFDSNPESARGVMFPHKAEQLRAEFERLCALRVAAELQKIDEKLKDPNTVHHMLLRGTIARPSLDQIMHVYAGEMSEHIAAILAAAKSEDVVAPEPLESDA